MPHTVGGAYSVIDMSFANGSERVRLKPPVPDEVTLDSSFFSHLGLCHFSLSTHVHSCTRLLQQLLTHFWTLQHTFASCEGLALRLAVFRVRLVCVCMTAQRYSMWEGWRRSANGAIGGAASIRGSSKLRRARVGEEAG